MHKYFVNRLVSVITATTAVMCISAVAFPLAQTEGVKETGQFVNAGDDTSSAVGKASYRSRTRSPRITRW